MNQESKSVKSLQEKIKKLWGVIKNMSEKKCPCGKKATFKLWFWEEEIEVLSKAFYYCYDHFLENVKDAVKMEYYKLWGVENENKMEKRIW